MHSISEVTVLNTKVAAAIAAISISLLAYGAGDYGVNAPKHLQDGRGHAAHPSPGHPGHMEHPKPGKPPSLASFEVQVSAADATSIKLQWQPVQGAVEYAVSRDGTSVGSTVSTSGFFSDFGLRPQSGYNYVVTAIDAAGMVIAESTLLSAATTGSAAIRTRYKVLAIAFNPEQANLITEQIHLKHRIQFLELASLRSATFDLYKGGIVATSTVPAVVPGTNGADFPDLVTRRDIPELDGNSIVDLIERGDIDHVWIVRAPVDIGENILIGSHPIEGLNGVTSENTWPPIPVKSSRSFFINGFLPDARAYDAYAHMVEGIMTSISDGHPDLWPRNLPYTVYTHDRESTATTEALLNTWEKFRLTDGWNGTSPVAYASPGRSNVGSSHFPPTTPRSCVDYCYSDRELATWQRYVDTEADDWLAFPLVTGTKRKINGYEFGAFNYYAEGDPSYSVAFGSSPERHYSFRYFSASYHQWWFAHLPHNPGVSNGKLNTWWPYLFDFNRFNGSRIDYNVTGFPPATVGAEPVGGEYGTDVENANDWGYWHSQNGLSYGAKAATLLMVNQSTEQQHVANGTHALRITVEISQPFESTAFGRNDVFYPISRNAHWNLSDLKQIRFSVLPGENAQLIANTNPIVRLYKNGNSRIEFVPRRLGAYANLFKDQSLRNIGGWYDFVIPEASSDIWEKNVIGYIDPSLPEAEQQAAKRRLEQEILADVNYVEISIRTTASDSTNPPYDVVTYYIDGLRMER